MSNGEISSEKRLQELAELLQAKAYLTGAEVSFIQDAAESDGAVDRTAKRLLRHLVHDSDVKPVLDALGGTKCKLSAIRDWLRQTVIVDQADQQQLATASS